MLGTCSLEFLDKGGETEVVIVIGKLGLMLRSAGNDAKYLVDQRLVKALVFHRSYDCLQGTNGT